jgi:hypothetical protein
MRGPNRPVVKLCSPYPRCFLFKCSEWIPAFFNLYDQSRPENQTKRGESDSFRKILKVLVYVFCSKRIDFRAILRNTLETPVAWGLYPCAIFEWEIHSGVPIFNGTLKKLNAVKFLTAGGGARGGRGGTEASGSEGGNESASADGDEERPVSQASEDDAASAIEEDDGEEDNERSERLFGYDPNGNGNVWDEYQAVMGDPWFAW